MHRFAAIALVTVLPQVARAADCASPYDVDSLFNDLGTAEAALRSSNYAEAIGTAHQMRAGLGCLDQPIPVVVVGRIYRAVGAGLYVEGESEDAARWFRSAAYADPGFAYGTQDFPAEHPVIRAWQAAKAEAVADGIEQPGAPLVDGKHFVDGKRVNFPVATPDALHVYQLEQDGRVRSWVIVGASFPPEATGAVVAEAPVAPVEATPEPTPTPTPVAPSASQAQVVKTRSWPAERVALVSGGAAALAGGGLLYALSAGARTSFDEATSVAELDRFQGRTNTYAVASGVSLAAGASAMGFGVLFFIVDGDPRPTLDLRF